LGLYFSGWFIKQKKPEAETGTGETSSDYTPMSDTEMDAELDRMEKED
jgi:hypothetical protein